MASIQELNEIRKQGFRPGVVGCFINNHKILFTYKKKFDLWQIPQGGIENGESIEKAFFREMAEELGQDFIKSVNSRIEIFGQDQTRFPHITKTITTDSGEKLEMVGKKHFFVAIQTNNSNIDIDQTEFDDLKWLTYDEAKNISEKITQKGKRRVTLRILELLKQKGLI